MDLNIRRMRKEDLAPLSALLADTRVMQYLEAPYTEEQTERFLEYAGLSEPPLIYAVEQEGAFIGYVIYHAFDDTGTEIGWVLDPKCWGKGYACALTERLIRRARTEGRDVVIECVPSQKATRRIAERFGFSYQGRRDGCDIYRLYFR